MARRSLHLPKPGERWCPQCNAYKKLSEFSGEDTYCRDHRKEARNRSRERARARGVFGPDVSKMTDAEFGKFVVWLLETNGEKEAATRLKGFMYD
jgi:hypothetical protein